MVVDRPGYERVEMPVDLDLGEPNRVVHIDRRERGRPFSAQKKSPRKMVSPRRAFAAYFFSASADLRGLKTSETCSASLPASATACSRS